MENITYWAVGARWSEEGKNREARLIDIFEKFNFAFVYEADESIKIQGMKKNDIVALKDGTNIVAVAYIEDPKLYKLKDVINKEEFRKYIMEERKDKVSDKEYEIIKERFDGIWDNAVGIKLGEFYILKKSIEYARSGYFIHKINDGNIIRKIKGVLKKK